MTEATEITSLYRALLSAWNHRDGSAFGSLFADDGSVVGFDGTPIEGRVAIVEHLSQIFADHTPPPYVAKVREERDLGSGVVMLRSIAGLIPAGANGVDPSLNAIQLLVAITHDGAWRIAHFQNTPIALHGRPDEVDAITAELDAVHARGELVDGPGD